MSICQHVIKSSCQHVIMLTIDNFLVLLTIFGNFCWLLENFIKFWPLSSSFGNCWQLLASFGNFGPLWCYHVIKSSRVILLVNLFNKLLSFSAVQLAHLGACFRVRKYPKKEGSSLIQRIALQNYAYLTKKRRNEIFRNVGERGQRLFGVFSPEIHPHSRSHQSTTPLGHNNHWRWWWSCWYCLTQSARKIS